MFESCSCSFEFAVVSWTLPAVPAAVPRHRNQPHCDELRTPSELWLRDRQVRHGGVGSELATG